MFYHTNEYLPVMDFKPLSFGLSADDNKKRGMPDMDQDEVDPHRGITKTPPQHEELLPDEAEEATEDDEEDLEVDFDEDDFADEVELDDDDEDES
jgi:hypothetical protein